MSFGSEPADKYSLEDGAKDLQFAKVTSISGQVPRRWGLRAMAQEAALKEIASSNMSRMLAYEQSFDCTDVKVGG